MYFMNLQNHTSLGVLSKKNPLSATFSITAAALLALSACSKDQGQPVSEKQLPLAPEPTPVHSIPHPDAPQKPLATPSPSATV